MSYLHSANRAQFAKPAGITIEYSTDGGSTWIDYGATNAEKVNLVSGIGSTFYIGKKTSNITINDKLRITVHATNCGIYTSLKTVLIDFLSNGATKCKILIEKAMSGSETTFSTVGTYDISGQSGWNSYPIQCNFGTLNNGSSSPKNVDVLRFTLSIGELNSSYANAARILDLQFFGTTYWRYPSNMAKTGHLYTWDYNQNATFPASITISKVGGLKYTGINSGTDNVNRKVWFADSSSDGTPVVNANFQYNPSTNILTVGSITGTAGKVANALSINGKTFDGASAVDAGTIGLAYGGTGATTAANALKNLIGTTAIGSLTGPIYWNGSTFTTTNPAITLAGHELNLGDSMPAETLRSALGLSNAMHFIGIATVAITDGSTTDPVITGYSTKTAGDVIIDKDSSYEYVWSGSKWERLGGDSSYKTIQTAVSDPAASGNSNTFIKTISQNSNGVITATKATIANHVIQVNGTAAGTYNGSAGVTLNLKDGDGIGVSDSNGAITFAHTNSVTAKTAYGSTATTASANGGSFIVTDVKYDAQGHVTGSVDRTITLSQITYSDVGAAAAEHTHTWSEVSDNATCTINTTGDITGNDITANGSIYAVGNIHSTNGNIQTEYGDISTQTGDISTESGDISTLHGDIQSTNGTITGSKVYGAVWNDYAEFRATAEDIIQPGYVTYSDDQGRLYKTTERLQAFEGIVSDTFGFAIGKTDSAKTPLAVAGRVLAYTDKGKSEFHSGDTVCAGPHGTVSKMTREEIIAYPDRIVGVVSEIPTYDTWGTGNVKVDGRIWIRLK